MPRIVSFAYGFRVLITCSMMLLLSIGLSSCGGGSGEDLGAGTQLLAQTKSAKTTLTIAPQDPYMIVGKPIAMSATVALREAAAQWTSSDPAVATIDVATGVVHAVAVGSTAITATAASGKSANTILTVTPVNVTLSVGPDPVAPAISVTYSTVVATDSRVVNATPSGTVTIQDANQARICESVLSSSTGNSATASCSAVPAWMGPAVVHALVNGDANFPGGAQSAGVSSSAPVLTDALFAPSSFWYAALPLNAPLHANSAGFVADFLRQKQAYYGTVNINTWQYASPVYIADASTPTTKVAYWNCQNKTYPETALQEQWAAVPLPPYAVPANGTDAEMTIYQPSTNTLWEFWVMRNIEGQWQACWGGRMGNTNTSDGTWPHPYGTTATGLPFLGGQITAEELKRGEIRHAIGISLVETEAYNVFSWPAKRSDGWNPELAPNRIPEGLRFRLDPGVDVDALAMSTAGKIVAKAAQKYGFVVWDKAGAISIRAQNPKSYTALGQIDPYIALFGGTPSYAVLNGFPWERLQFMPMDYGKP